MSEDTECALCYGDENTAADPLAQYSDKLLYHDSCMKQYLETSPHWSGHASILRPLLQPWRKVLPHKTLEPWWVPTDPALVVRRPLRMWRDTEFYKSTGVDLGAGIADKGAMVEISFYADTDMNFLEASFFPASRWTGAVYREAAVLHSALNLKKHNITVDQLPWAHVQVVSADGSQSDKQWVADIFKWFSWSPSPSPV